MSLLLSDSVAPLIILIPLWLVLIKLGKILKSLNKGRLSKKRSLALFDAVDSTRLPVILLTLVYYIRYVIGVNVDEGSTSFFLAFLNSHFYFFVNLSLFSHASLKFAETYKRDLTDSYTREELLFDDLSRSLEKTQVDAVSKVIKGVWVIITTILFLNHFGVPASSILAFGGMGSLILGFAAKDVLSDVLSGLLLYFDKQFNIGDWIKIENPFIEGTVESIGWRVSKIKTFDNRPVYVPNKFLGTAIIQNVSRRESMRFKETLTLDIESMDVINSICTEIRSSIFLNHDGIDEAKSIIVNLSSLDGAVANIYISAYTKSIDVVDFYSIKQDIWLKIHKIVTMHGSSIKPPFLHLFDSNR